MRFAALGRTQWLYDGIAAAEERGHRCVLIATAPAASEYRVQEDHFATYAKKLACPFISDVRLDRPQHMDAFKQSGAEIAISVNWPTLISKTVRDQFPRGVLNAHCGDLPRYRGNACPNWAILNGEKDVVVSIHEMLDELDAGPILLQDRMDLTESTYIGDVYQWLNVAIPRLWGEVVDGLQSGGIIARAQPQDPGLSLRCFPRIPQDALIRWDQPAERIGRLIRASAEPFGGAFTHLAADRLIVWRGYAKNLGFPYCGVPGQIAEIRRHSGEVLVLASEGVVVLQEVELSGLGRTRAAEVIRSTRLRLGFSQFEAMIRLEDRVSKLEETLKKLDRK